MADVEYTARALDVPHYFQKPLNLDALDGSSINETWAGRGRATSRESAMRSGPVEE